MQTKRLDRSNTRCLSAHVPEDMYWQLKKLAVDKRQTMESAIMDAVNRLFEENSLPVIQKLD